ncbi:MAG: DNA-binding response regulator [Acidiferrobacteraceae bacterium]|nr:DNA-binding response regulator [Acidiferrobacteraceae bacterium]
MNPQNNIKIFIVDDHAVVRQGLKHIVSQAKDLEVVGEAENGWDALENIPGQEIDVVLMDIEMPHKTGLEALVQLKSMAPKLPVIILSIFEEEQYGIRLIQSGAAGYLSKTCPPEQLIEAVRKVAEGGKYISPSLGEKLVMSIVSNSGTSVHENLSNREYQVFFMLASGKKVKEVAKDLSISINTVNTHRSRILAKMNLENNSEIIRYALKNKLVK